jgi:hypothetical protein
MPKLSDLRTARHVRAEDLRDPEIRAEYDRTALAHAVAMRVLKYRTDHGLSQSALGRELGMAQPAIARLEPLKHFVKSVEEHWTGSSPGMQVASVTACSKEPIRSSRLPKHEPAGTGASGR